MIAILHYLKDPKLWELWYIPYYGYCSIYTINRSFIPSVMVRSLTERRKGLEFMEAGTGKAQTQSQTPNPLKD